ncbi:uncharacterized protein LOC143204882 isoform X2 [Rhynchophorus ferrugineus]|uniref:uncharacterized protein LOC143204882 isoform X2 n=1 Tax=Rhynchophorus ferrugineus TaxID=354439 RepID=UPI003FCC3D14
MVEIYTHQYWFPLVNMTKRSFKRAKTIVEEKYLPIGGSIRNKSGSDGGIRGNRGGSVGNKSGSDDGIRGNRGGSVGNKSGSDDGIRGNRSKPSNIKAMYNILTYFII